MIWNSPDPIAAMIIITEITIAKRDSSGACRHYTFEDAFGEGIRDASRQNNFIAI